jgi:hypothetical protein
MARKKSKRKSRLLNRPSRITRPPGNGFITKARLWKSASILITLVGIASAYVTILGFWLPRLNVQPLMMSDAEDALSTNFSVSNQGSMMLYDMNIRCKLKDSLVKITTETGQEGIIGEVGGPEDNHPSLAPMKSATFQCMLSLPVEDGLDIFIIVYYRPAFYPFKRRQAFRFVSTTSSDGQMQWLPQPESDYDDDSENPFDERR